MNILIVQQLAWGQRIGAEVARVLAAEGHRLSALVHGRDTMDDIRRQREVPYASVHFADPLYDAGHERVSERQIAEIEERYGLESLWRIAYSERWLIFTFLSSRTFAARKPVGNDYILSVCWSTYRFVREIMEQARPAYVLAPAVGSLANYFLYLECRRAGIPFYSISFSRFGNHFYIADDLYLCSTRIAARFDELRDLPDVSPRYGEARRLSAAIRRDDPASRPTYLHRGGALRPSLRQLIAAGRDVALFPARVAKALLRTQRVMEFDNIWVPTNSRWNAARNVWINLRERFVQTDHQGRCLTSLDDLTFTYVHFPLHVEPELSLLVFAPEHANQVELCRRIALGLPRGVRLLVKEHPMMVRSRRPEFYEALRGLPNVEIAHSGVSSHALVTHPRCRATVVVSSSVGFEAAMNGCPVVLLAPVQYSVLPNVTLVSTVEEAQRRLRDLCTAPPSRRDSDAEPARLAYLCALLENSFSFDYVERWNSGEGSIDARRLVEAVHARLAERPPPVGAPMAADAAAGA